jgi:hypothetical protein
MIRKKKGKNKSVPGCETKKEEKGKNMCYNPVQPELQPKLQPGIQPKLGLCDVDCDIDSDCKVSKGIHNFFIGRTLSMAHS